ncbi:hypothetical protein XA68_17981 [Ophiocordyceps unilateralis]|uniref:Uncharacterized protein n=1 Tax=Ophiocordyceps unilateralis TaxID=268505 RepID=A0A2A9P342_OPHUN|nr:hypothetical protein XA68_17981 [Ophiocordyceps unilateralis]
MLTVAWKSCRTDGSLRAHVYSSNPQIPSSDDWRTGDEDASGALGMILASPTDSGYGSVGDSQQSSPLSRRHRAQPCLDGQESCDESLLAAEPTRRLTTEPTSVTESPDASTKERQLPLKLRLHGLLGYFKAYSGDARPSLEWSSRAVCNLDRFVPIRSALTTTTERYRIKEKPDPLSSYERLARCGRERAGHLAALGIVRSSAHSEGVFDDGRGHLLWRGTNARLSVMSSLAERSTAQGELESYRGRVALALEIDRIRKILDFSSALSRSILPAAAAADGTACDAFERLGREHYSQHPSTSVRTAAPFRVLDAPSLRDDYYCSILAYSATSRILAVGLGNVLYT